MMRLISAERRNNYKCHICGCQPVKYFMRGVLVFGDGPDEEHAYCSKCALSISTQEREHDTFMEDEERR